MTIGDKVQFKTYLAPCIFLGMKQTAPVDNEVWRPYQAEFGVTGISASSAQPPMIFHLQLQNQIQRDCIHLPSSILSWEWFQDKLQTYCCLWLVIYLKMTHHMTKHDSWHSWWRHLENNYWWILLGCTEVSLMLYWSIPYDMLSFPFLVWVRMTFACIIPVMFLSEFELAPNC